MFDSSPVVAVVLLDEVQNIALGILEPSRPAVAESVNVALACHARHVVALERDPSRSQSRNLGVEVCDLPRGSRGLVLSSEVRLIDEKLRTTAADIQHAPWFVNTGLLQAERSSINSLPRSRSATASEVTTDCRLAWRISPREHRQCPSYR